VLRVYNYVVDNNIQKLTKSDKKISQYIQMIYPRCVVEHLAAYNKKQFVDEVTDPKSGEPTN
jgi:hypothetical protein